MKRVDALSGSLRCCECRQVWGSTWNTHAPVIICHECGGQCEPVGPQIPVTSIDGEIFRLQRAAARLTLS